MPIAPNDFYANGQSDNTAIHFVMNDAWYVKGEFVWQNDMANPNKYTNNMIKWDIINDWCFTAYSSFTKARITEFEREGINIKYHIQYTLDDWSTTNNWYSSIYDTHGSDTNYDFVPMCTYDIEPGSYTIYIGGGSHTSINSRDCLLSYFLKNASIVEVL
jgi:hypothetical protein